MTKIRFPGYVDLQVNGYLGVDFSDPELSPAEFTHACQAILRTGTAAFLPTIITSSSETYRHNLPIIAKTITSKEFSGRLLGIHVEGPFISSQPGFVGAHNPTWTRPADIEFLRQLIEWADGRIRLLTLAAELEGAEELTRYAKSEGIIVSIGHSMANPDSLTRLHQAGANALTHLGNGLPATLPKFDNPIWAGLADDRYTAMMIGDGHHILARILKTMIRAKGVERTIIVSDSAPVAGLPPGEYTTLGNRAVLDPSGRLHNPEKGCLVGSSYNLPRCMEVLESLGFCKGDLITMGYKNPLRLLQIDSESYGPNL